MPRITYGPREIAEEKIKEILVNRYCSGYPESIAENMKRKLIRTDCFNNYGGIGLIIFSLDGSPPKGYALFIRELRLIHFFDVSGNPFKTMGDITLINESH